MSDVAHVVIRSNIHKVVAGFTPSQMKSLKEAVGLRLVKAFKEKIKSGDSGWAPLSPAWIEEKGHSGQWYYTGRLEKAIEYKVDASGVRTGVLKYSSYPDSGESVAAVALGLEYGRGAIPARPLFRPVFEEQAKGIVADATKDIQARVKRAAI